MQFKKVVLFFYIFILSGALYGQINTANIHFRSPVDYPIFLSGNFGEIRSTHFHSGIDIKTNGVEGKEIYAVEKGFISRIRISANSYGKTLYIEHPNGYTTVYAHLSKFNSQLEKLVKDIQYQNNEFEVNYFPENGELRVKKGELIGYSGNTGSSTGPHLHFEIRETKRQIPVNPLFFDFKITDRIAPVFYSLSIYPKGKSSYVNHSQKPLNFELTRSDNLYSIKDTNEIIISGPAGFGVEINDYLDHSNNPCGIYSLSLYVDTLKIYAHTIDKISFSEAGYIKSHIDYAEKKKSKKSIQKTFIDPNNQLSIYERPINRGIFNFRNDTTHTIKLVAKDVYGNESVLKFRVKSHDHLPLPEIRKPSTGQPMHWDTANRFETENIKVEIPTHALYDMIYFNYSKSDAMEHSFSEIHHIHNEFTPLHKNFNLSIKPKNLPDHLSEKAFIAQIEKSNNGKENEISFYGGEIEDEFIVTQTKSFGSYTVLVDTIAPEIKIVTENGKMIHPDKQIKFLITDELSGIKSYNGFIDNNWALFEYDPKNDLLFYTIDEERIEKNKEHELELFVVDHKDNITTYYTTFNW